MDICQRSPLCRRPLSALQAHAHALCEGRKPERIQAAPLPPAAGPEAGPTARLRPRLRESRSRDSGSWE